jgi:transposase
VALDYAKLPNDPEELKQLLLKHANWVVALREEVLRLRRWRFGRSSEAVNVSLAPELSLTGGVTPPPPPVPQTTSDVLPPVKLTSVEPLREKRGSRRPSRSLPAELPRVIHEHPPLETATAWSSVSA